MYAVSPALYSLATPTPPFALIADVPLAHNNVFLQQLIEKHTINQAVKHDAGRDKLKETNNCREIVLEAHYILAEKSPDKTPNSDSIKNKHKYLRKPGLSCSEIILKHKVYI